jgi:hypothetical protein
MLHVPEVFTPFLEPVHGKITMKTTTGFSWNIRVKDFNGKSILNLAAGQHFSLLTN